MKKRKFLSMVLSISMALSSLTAMTVAEAETNEFAENFTSYSEDVTVNFSRGETATEELVATHPSGAMWKTSKVYAGRYFKQAYVGIESDNDQLTIHGFAEQLNAVNLDLEPLNAGKISKMEVSVRSFDRMSGIQIFVSKDEKSGYLIGRRNDSQGIWDCGAIATDILNNPFVVKGLGAQATMVEQPTTQTWAAFDKGTDTTKYTVEVDGDNIHWTAVSGTYTSSGVIENAKPEMDNYRYPLSLITVGGQTAQFKDIKVWYDTKEYDPTEGKMLFEDDFKGHTRNSETITHISGTAQDIMTYSSGAKWIASGVYTGYSAAGTSTSMLDADWDKLTVKGAGGGWTSANLDISALKAGKIAKIEATIDSNANLSGIGLFVSEDEKDGYFLGRKCSSEGFWGVGNNGDAADYNNPFTARNFAGSSTLIEQPTPPEAWSNGYESGKTTYAAIVKDDNTIEWTATSGTLTSSGTITGAAAVIESCRYPISVVTSGNRGASLTNVKIWYEFDATIGAKSFSDSFTSYASDNEVTHVSGTAIEVAAHSTGAKWLASGSHRGQSGAKTTLDAAYDKLTVKSSGWGWALANLELSALNVKSISKIQATVDSHDNMSGIGIFINGAETDGYVIGRKSGNFWGVGDNGSAAVSNNPFAVRGFDGGATLLEQPTPATDWVNSYSGTYETTYTIDVVDGKTINWTATSGTYTSGGTISNAKTVIDNYVYPLSLVTAGDQGASIRNVKVWYEESEYSFSETFAGYVDADTITQNDIVENGVCEDFADESKTDTRMNYIGHRMADGSAVLGTHLSGAEWVTSDVFTGSYYGETSSTHYGNAYIDISSKALVVKGWGIPHFAAVNLDFGADKKVENLTKAEFTMEAPPKNAGVRMFVSGNERAYIEFGWTGAEESLYGKDGDTVLYRFTPRIRKVVPLENTSDKLTIANAANVKESYIYAGSAFAIGTSEGVCNTSTVTTTGAWGTSTNTEITYTVNVEADGTLRWIAKGNGGGYSEGVIADDDVKAQVLSNWVYPFAAASSGDQNGTKFKNFAMNANVVDYSAEYEKKAYSKADFEALYKEAAWGRKSDVLNLLKLDLSDVREDAASVNFKVENTVIQTNPEMTGAHWEFDDSFYSTVYDDGGEMRQDYIDWARSQEPVSSVRFGGTTSNSVNFLKSLQGEDSEYLYKNVRTEIPGSENGSKWVSAIKPADQITEADLSESEVENLINKYISSNPGVTADNMTDAQHREAIGAWKLARTNEKLSLAKVMKAVWVNNPDATFMLSISPYTTTPQEAGQLVKILTGTGTNEKAQRLNYFGSEDPIKLYAIELGNEIDGRKADFIKAWYLDIAADMITEIKNNDASGTVKIIACGPTAPWGDSSDTLWGGRDAGFAWVDSLINGVTYNNTHYAGIAGKIDAMSFHPYYYADRPKMYLGVYTDNYYRMFKEAGYEDVDISVTEHAVWWDEENSFYSSPMSTGLFGALANSYFLLIASERDYITSAYSHGLMSSSAMYARWQYDNNDKKFHENPLSTMYNLLGKSWGNSLYNSNVTVTADKTDLYMNEKTSDSFSAAAVKVSNDTAKLIFVNNQGYVPVDVDITLPDELADYTLISEEIYTAPNMFSFMSDADSANLATITEGASAKGEVFGNRTYTVPNKSMVVLTLTGDPSVAFIEEFNTNTAAVSPIVDNDNWTAEANKILENDIGIWSTSASIQSTGYGDSGFGTAQVADGKLVLKTAEGSTYTMGANWDITKSGKSAKDIKKITFTTTGAGGVKLFGNVESQKVSDDWYENADVSDYTFDASANTDWVITINNGVLTWEAGKTGGTISITENNMLPKTSDNTAGYDFFFHAYALNAAGFTIDNIEITFAEGEPVPAPKLISYEKTSDKLSVTVTPSAAGKAINVFAAYYLGSTLIKIENIGEYEGNSAADTVKVSLPEAGETAKIFVWDSYGAQTPIQPAVIAE